MGLDLTGLGSVFDFAKGIADRFFPPKATEAEKLAAAAAMAPVIEERETKLIDAQKDIIVAELQQGDNYTKRARPTIIYTGLGVIVFTKVVMPVVMSGLIILFAFLGSLMTPEQFKIILAELEKLKGIDMPAEFWLSWSGVSGVYAIGRTLEKKGYTNKIISAITGNK
ncbi:MAG: 3TM-type holin [Desulfobacterales bacterium]|nr:3TM-type holin [Desulfobacterales bacterium]